MTTQGRSAHVDWGTASRGTRVPAAPHQRAEPGFTTRPVTEPATRAGGDDDSGTLPDVVRQLPQRREVDLGGADATASGRSLTTRALDQVAQVVPPVRLFTDAASILIVTALVIGETTWPILATFLPTLALFRLYAPEHGVTYRTLLGDLPPLLYGAGIATLLQAALFPNVGLRDAAFVAAAVFVFLVIGRGTMHLVAEILRSRGFGCRPTLVIGRGPTVAHLVQKVEKHKELGLRVVGVVASPSEDEDDTIVGVQPEDLPELVTRYGIRQLVLVPEDEHLDFVTRCFLAVDGFKVNAALVPPLRDFLLSPAGVEHIEGIPLISLGRLSYAPRMMPGKRLVDIVGSLIGLFLLAPVLAAIAVAIRMEDRGPVFFAQRRAGFRGRYFKMLKFRSMCTDAEDRLDELSEENDSDGLLFKIRDDPRVTRVGSFIRKTSLDELPQLLNVLKGDMSLVGPRALPVEVEHFGDLAIKRLNVRPGCTGFWQVLGRSDLTYEEMVKLDLSYIQNWSLWVDLQLMLKTLPVLLLRKGAY